MQLQMKAVNDSFSTIWWSMKKMKKDVEVELDKFAFFKWRDMYDMVPYCLSGGLHWHESTYVFSRD